MEGWVQAELQPPQVETEQKQEEPRELRLHLKLLHHRLRGR